MRIVSGQPRCVHSLSYYSVVLVLIYKWGLDTSGRWRSLCDLCVGVSVAICICGWMCMTECAVGSPGLSCVCVCARMYAHVCMHSTEFYHDL